MSYFSSFMKLRYQTQIGNMFQILLLATILQTAIDQTVRFTIILSKACEVVKQLFIADVS